jgi:hypothetical protein
LPDEVIPEGQQHHHLEGSSPLSDAPTSHRRGEAHWHYGMMPVNRVLVASIHDRLVCQGCVHDG